MPLVIPYSAACERNKDDILEVIQPYLNKAKIILEIGTGTAQHAVFFAQSSPQILWQTSDQQEHLDGIRAQLKNSKVDNVLMPIELNVKQNKWVDNQQQFDIVYTANTFHIMRWSEVELFFKSLNKVINNNAIIIVYGPFKYKGEFTSPSNAVFDQSLRSRECGCAIRDFETVNELAKATGFDLIKDHSMPANNQCLVWRVTK